MPKEKKKPIQCWLLFSCGPPISEESALPSELMQQFLTRVTNSYLICCMIVSDVSAMHHTESARGVILEQVYETNLALFKQNTLMAHAFAVDWPI